MKKNEKWFIVRPCTNTAKLCNELLSDLEFLQENISITENEKTVGVVTAWKVTLEDLQAILKAGIDQALGLDFKVAVEHGDGQTVRWADKREYIPSAKARASRSRSVKAKTQRPKMFKDISG